MTTNNPPLPTVSVEACDIDLMDEFDCDEIEQRNSLVVAEEFDNLIAEFDNSRVSEVVEDIAVITTTTTFPVTAAVYLPNVPETIPVAETTAITTISSIPMAETTTADALYSYNNNHSLDDDDMLVEAIEIMASCDAWQQEGPSIFTPDDGSEVEHAGSQFVEYSTDPFESKHALADVQLLHNKMDTFMSDNEMLGSTDFMEDDDIEVFATMMQTIEQEHIDQAGDQVENKHIMQAMIASNQQHVQEVTALQQQQDDIAVQIGPICTAPFLADTELPQFSVGCSTDSSVSNITQKKKSTTKKKKEKKPPSSGSGFAPESEDDYESQKNVLRQVATAKRTRTAGKFEKRKIEWVSITDAMKNNNNS